MLSSDKVDQEGQVLSGEVVDDPGHAHDAVFGKISDDGPNYRNVRNRQMSRSTNGKANTNIFRSDGLAQQVS